MRFLSSFHFDGRKFGTFTVYDSPRVKKESRAGEVSRTDNDQSSVFGSTEGVLVSKKYNLNCRGTGKMNTNLVYGMQKDGYTFATSKGGERLRQREMD